MALINCKNCGQLMSDKAVNCPHCGAPADHETKAAQPQYDDQSAHPDFSQNQQPDNQDALDADIQNYIDDVDNRSSGPLHYVLLFLAVLVGVAAVLGIVIMGGKIYDAYNEKPNTENVGKHFYNDDDGPADDRQEDVEPQPVAEQREEAPFLEIGTFCERYADANVIGLRRGSAIHRNLIDLGFKMTNQTERYDDGGDVTPPWTAVKRTYRKDSSDGITEVIVDNIDKSNDQLWVGVVTITFATDERKYFFIGSAEKVNFRHEGSNLYGPNQNCYWAGSDVRLNGNTAEIVQRFEP